VRIIIVLWRRHDEFEFGVLADVEDEFGGDVRVVNDSNGHRFLVAVSDTLEVNDALLNEDIGADYAGADRQSQLFSTTNIDDNLGLVVDFLGGHKSDSESELVVSRDLALHRVHTEFLIGLLHVEDS
jgi:hypothetical protein